MYIPHPFQAVVQSNTIKIHRMVIKGFKSHSGLFHDLYALGQSSFYGVFLFQ